MTLGMGKIHQDGIGVYAVNGVVRLVKSYV